MALTSVMALLVLVVSAQGNVGPSTNSSFCSESRECLEYELVCKTDEYEVRHYSPTRWVSTDAEAYFMGVGAAMAFRRLFQYITGANEGGFQMDMVAPVLVKIPEDTRMWEPAIYTLSFPLPSAYQDKPPQPTNDKLYFTEMPEMDVYVRSYGGWMLSVTARLHAHLLTKELERVRALFNCTYHYGVGYDSPLKLLNRHNEVWYVSEGEPVCTDPQEPTPPHPTRLQSDQHPYDYLPDDPPTDPPSDAPSDPSSQLPEAPSPTTDNSTTSNSSQAPPTGVSLSQATPRPSEQATPSSPSSLRPTDAALSQAPSSTHAALDETPGPSNTSLSVGPSADTHSTPPEPEDPTHDEQ